MTSKLCEKYISIAEIAKWKETVNVTNKKKLYEVLRQSALSTFSLHVFLNSVSNMRLIVREREGTIMPVF